MTDAVPAECRDVDFRKSLDLLPPRFGDLFLAAGENRLSNLDSAMDRGDAAGVMEAAHALANLTGVLHIRALAGYTQTIYDAAEKGDLAAAAPAHQRLRLVMVWALGRVRDLGLAAAQA